MKKLFIILLFLSTRLYCNATEWLQYYVYVQQDYSQGPWSRMYILEKSKDYQYLHPKLCEGLFGSEPEQLAFAIIDNLRKENRDRYTFNPTLSVLGDTVIIKAKKLIPDFRAVKNEIIASFLLNNFEAVRIIQPGSDSLYRLKDITVPYMDLIAPQSTPGKTDSAEALNSQPANTSIEPSLIKKQTPNKGSEKNILIWLFLSAAFNTALIICLISRRRRYKPINKS